MQHSIPSAELGPRGQAMADAVSSCVHCGFCLPACPTYQVLGEEMDSPRGRIFLMKDVLEDRLPLEQALPYVDRCLGCLGCEPACPSGVQYGDLITSFRAHSERKRSRTFFDRLMRQVVLQTLPYTARFRWAARLGKLASFTSPLLPHRLSNMLAMLPAQLPPSEQLPEVTPAIGPRRARVALLAGCAQQVLAPQINRAAIELLSRNGVEVVVPQAQGCCGALAAHTGADRLAMEAARKNLRAFPGDINAVVTTAAGCGSGMHEYPLWLKGTQEEAQAHALASMTKDVCVFLAELGPVGFAPLADPLRVAYHDACHLAHGQGVREQPRQLLQMIGNLELVEVPDREFCCGSAGTYNLEQPEVATELGERKAAAIVSTEAQAVATGNIGCMVQIENHLADAGRCLPVKHTIEWLADSCLDGHGSE
ncbi:glycolate oxidase subunit GlcF [Adhaeretor mobilis]|uniref:Glycolate oxidase iron-sulfur subunit n=1 Tax=Adhaeretor mobilis TaxID=1930276 RepID=A0A517MXG0_9BACT|nr:glycolate oxidase subunit GlcF [Adhaeretor mobilis]QDS99561.1 Lactate utilization protein A [Adhaeretor mobilis]